MKIFATAKSLIEIAEQCELQKIALDTSAYEDKGSDYVGVDFKGSIGVVLFSTVNGYFLGRHQEIGTFNSTRTDLDDEPWFNKLLDFFYVNEEQTA